MFHSNLDPKGGAHCTRMRFILDKIRYASSVVIFELFQNAPTTNTWVCRMISSPGQWPKICPNLEEHFVRKSRKSPDRKWAPPICSKKNWSNFLLLFFRLTDRGHRENSLDQKFEQADRTNLSNLSRVPPERWGSCWCWSCRPRFCWSCSGSRRNDFQAQSSVVHPL